MSIVKCTNRRQGVTYVYDSQCFFDEVQNKYRYKRTLLGKIDPETGLMVPTGKRGGYHPPKQNPGEEQPPLEHLKPGRKKKVPVPIITDEALREEMEKLRAENQSLEEKVTLLQAQLASEKKSHQAAAEEHSRLVNSLRKLILD